MDLKETLDNLIEISSLAGSEILDVYNGNINVPLNVRRLIIFGYLIFHLFKKIIFATILIKKV